MRAVDPRHRALRFKLLAGVCAAASAATANAVNTINFSLSSPGVTKSVDVWGVDTAWPNFDNVRQNFAHIGQENVEIVRILVFIDEPLETTRGGSFALNDAAKAKVDQHLALAAMAGPDVALTFGLGGASAAEIDPDYVSGGGINVTNYARVIKATQEYVNSRPGFTNSPIYAIEPFNEPDFNFPNANPADLESIIQQLQTYPEFANTLMMSPSVLNSDLAQGWYDQTPSATAGSSHLLAGSLTTWVNFIEHVQNDGNPFINPEIHSMAEMLVGAEHGMLAGMTWAEVLHGRGTLIRAMDGSRLGYAENYSSQSAGAVYRSPEGEVYAFAGGVERDYMGTPDSYRFVSTDQDVWFNGIPVREFMLQTNRDLVADDNDNDFANYGSWSHEGAFAHIDTDPSGIPPLDGLRWKIVNEQTGELMEVVNSGVADGALIETAADNGRRRQLWNIRRTRNGYYELYNDNSGRTAEVAGLSLGIGADVRQWGTADNSGQQWFIEEAGGGAFYLRNGHSNLYLDADTGNGNVQQWSLNGGDNQKWRFVLANPEDDAVARYRMQGNASDSTGSGNHATAFGSPSYTTGPTGAPNDAVNLDGVNDYLQVPSSVSSSEDLTVATWIRWDGGGDWQRIFDFGLDTNQYLFLTPRSGDGTLRFAVTDTSNGGEQVLETDPLPVGEWVHLTLTLGGNTGVLYVNGVPRVAGQIVLDATDIDTSNSYIGRSQWPDPLLDGAISDFQVFDYALSMAQVMNLVRPGDFNGDGLVDAADYVTWRDGYGVTYNDADYDSWATNYGADYTSLFSTGGSASVPEPGAWAILIAASMAAVPGRRRLA